MNPVQSGDCLIATFHKGPVALVTVSHLTADGNVVLREWPDDQFFGPTGWRVPRRDKAAPQHVRPLAAGDDAEAIKEARQAYIREQESMARKHKLVKKVRGEMQTFLRDTQAGLYGYAHPHPYTTTQLNRLDQLLRNLNSQQEGEHS